VPFDPQVVLASLQRKRSLTSNDNNESLSKSTFIDPSTSSEPNLKDEMDRMVQKMNALCMTPSKQQQLKYLSQLIEQTPAELVWVKANAEDILEKMKQSRRKKATKAATGEARVLQMEVILENKEKKLAVLEEKVEARLTRDEIRVSQAEWKRIKKEVFPRDIRVFR
jgi:hypothetical protein